MKRIFRFTVLSSVLFAGTFAYASKAPLSVAPTTEAVSTTPSLASAPNMAEALKEFKSLSRHDRKERIKAAKEELKRFKQEKKAGNEPSTNTLLLVILAILLPPLAVYLHEGAINGKFWLSLVLTLLFWIPGVIYALIVVLGK